MPFIRKASCTISNLESKKAIVVTDLRITFDIKKKRKGDENEATISVYNLNDLSRGALQVVETEGGDGQIGIELRAGYQDVEESVLFKGIGKLVSEWKEPNWVTTIQATDGVVQLASTTFEKKYPKGMPISQIIIDIITASGLTVGRLVPPPGLLINSRTFSGPPAKILGDLASTYNFTIDIQSEVASTQVGVTPVGNLLTLSVGTGLIGVPVRRGTIVECESVIQPGLIPGVSITLLSDNHELTGLYILKSLDCKGDSWSGPWAMKLQMEIPTVSLPFNLDNGVDVSGIV